MLKYNNNGGGGGHYSLRPPLLVLLVLLAASFPACDTPTEACMDPVANNFNPEADKDCCCTYFQLKFNLQHKLNDSTALTFFTNYPNPSGGNDSFQVQSARILLSEFTLTSTTGAIKPIEDTLTLELANTTNITTADDYTNINPAIFVVNIGKFTQVGDYTLLSFTVGLSPALQSAQYAQLPDNHELGAFYNATNQQYYSQSYNIIRSAWQDTFSVQPIDTVHISLPLFLPVSPNWDSTLPIDILYGKIWEGIDWYHDDQTTIHQKIKTNIRNAIIIHP